MIEEEISSFQNPKIKHVRDLYQRKFRDETGLFLVEGIRHVGEAVQSNAGISYVLYAPELMRSDFAWEMIHEVESRGLAVYPVRKDIFERISDKNGPQGILAVVEQSSLSLEKIPTEKFPWLMAVVEPQDPGNIGTMLRTLDAAGADGLILLEGGSDPWHPTAVRASMGTVFTMPVIRATFTQFTGWAMSGGAHVYGTSAKGSEDYRAISYRRPCVLLLGSEREGLSDRHRLICSAMVRLPMLGRGSSLNLAVASGILLYQMLAFWDHTQA